MNIIREVGKLSKERFMALLIYIYSTGACDVYEQSPAYRNDGEYLSWLVAKWLGLDLFEEGEDLAEQDH